MDQETAQIKAGIKERDRIRKDERAAIAKVAAHRWASDEEMLIGQVTHWDNKLDEEIATYNKLKPPGQQAVKDQKTGKWVPVSGASLPEGIKGIKKGLEQARIALAQHRLTQGLLNVTGHDGTVQDWDAEAKDNVWYRASDFAERQYKDQKGIKGLLTPEQRLEVRQSARALTKKLGWRHEDDVLDEVVGVAEADRLRAKAMGVAPGADMFRDKQGGEIPIARIMEAAGSQAKTWEEIVSGNEMAGFFSEEYDPGDKQGQDGIVWPWQSIWKAADDANVPPKVIVHEARLGPVKSGVSGGESTGNNKPSASAKK
jgi:hypothetical protein